MPIPINISAFCVKVATGPGEVCITMPGGSKMCASVAIDIYDPTDHVKALFSQLNAALAPLLPLFDIMDTIMAVVKCVEAIPDSIGPPPDPTALLQCIPNMLEQVNKLLSMLVPISIPQLAKDVLTALILLLQGMRARIQQLLNQLDRIVAAETRAAQLPAIELQAIADCARANLDVQLVNINAGLSPVNRMISIINALLDLAGLPCIPEFNLFATLDPGLLDLLDSIIELLEYIRSLIAVPELALSAQVGKPCDQFESP